MEKNKETILKLKLPTDPFWANLAIRNLPEIMTDHAYCEQKAASSAISLIVHYPEYTGLVEAMSELAIEEMQHFRMVHKEMIKRGWSLGRERKDHYVHDLMDFFPPGPTREEKLIQKLLLAAMIEARSCERFKMLSENIEDEDLSDFYYTLMKSEANHYSMFLRFARQYGVEIIDVDGIWEKFLDYEARIIKNYGKKERMHG